MFIDLMDNSKLHPCVGLHHNRWSPGGCFKNAYELLNLRALKISMLYTNHIFQCMGKIFCVEFLRVPLKFHAKYLTYTLKDVHFIHRWKFKSSYPACREMLGRRWANAITYVGAMSANEVGPAWLCPSMQRWHHVVTPPTMTLCQRNNLLHFVIFDGTALAQCIMNGWLSVGITSLSPIACRRLRLR